jgi:hypothetical protein
MALPYSTRTSWVVKSVTTTKTSSADLLPFELGIFSYGDNKVVQGFQQNPYIYFAVGSPNQGQRISSSPKVRPLMDKNSTVSFKTDKMYGKELLPTRVGVPKKTSQPQVTYIGYDGINDCTNLDMKYGKTYAITIHIYGSAAKGVFGVNHLQDTVTVTLPTKDSCDTSCTEPNLGYLVIDELVNKINNSWIAPAIRAEKLESCCDATAITKFNCQEYTLTLCDEGNENSLAKVQSQYPDKKISIKSRVGTTTTYSFVQDSALAAPAAFSQSSIQIIGCTTCPAGTTTTAAAKILVVEIDNAGAGANAAAWLAEVQAVIPTAISANRVNFAFGTSTYVVTVPTTYVLAAIADGKVTDTGKTSPIICTQTTPVTTAWVVGAVTYRVKRTLVVTLDNPECSGTELTSLVASYSTLSDVVPGSIVVQEAGTCRTVFTLDQYSNCMEDGCDTIAVAAFKDLPAYKGQTWMVNPCEGWTVSATGCPIPPATATIKDCRVGVKIIGGFLDLSNGSCIFDPNNAVNYDPINFDVSITEVMKVGEPGGMAIPTAPITVNRETGRKFLTGQEVIREIIEYRYYKHNEMYMNPDAFAGAYRFSDAEGQKFGVDVNKFYYAVYVNHDKLGRQWNSIMDMSTKTELALYFAEEDYPVMLQFLAAYNGYAMSAGVSLPAIVV